MCILKPFFAELILASAAFLGLTVLGVDLSKFALPSSVQISRKGGGSCKGEGPGVLPPFADAVPERQVGGQSCLLFHCNQLWSKNVPGRCLLPNRATWC